MASSFSRSAGASTSSSNSIGLISREGMKMSASEAARAVFSVHSAMTVDARLVLLLCSAIAIIH
jgi:hypothetical protein